jgi:hypothetical protein
MHLPVRVAIVAKPLASTIGYSIVSSYKMRQFPALLALPFVRRQLVMHVQRIS